MKRSVLAAALALACALSLAAPAFAAEKAPSLAGDSKTTAVAKVYEYDPHRYLANGNSVYGNTLTVAADERVYDDSGKLWRVTDSSAFYDSSAFRCSVKTTANAMNARSVRQSDEPIVGAGARFVVTLSKDGMYDNTGIGFTVTYTAVKDTALPVSPLGANTGTASELAVKSGAKIVIDYTLRITEDTLFPSSYLKTSPDWYGDLFYFKDVEHPIGAEDIVLTPTQEGDSDYTWEDEDIIVAELSGSDIFYAPKLSTRRADTGRNHTAPLGEMYTRFFRGNPDAKGGTLTLTNPYLTFDGEETVPHRQIHIYEATEAGDLKDVTSRFKYTADSDGRGAFSAKVRTLGNYIITATELK